MATYECSICGMSVNATCGHCGAALVNDVLTRDEPRFISALDRIEAENAAMLADLEGGLTLDDIRGEQSTKTTKEQ